MQCPSGVLRIISVKITNNSWEKEEEEEEEEKPHQQQGKHELVEITIYS